MGKVFDRDKVSPQSGGVRILSLLLSLTFCAISPAAQACSYVPVEGKTSEWLEDKVVFWGIPTETKWDPALGDGDQPFGNTKTKIDVIKTLKGDLPKMLDVRHSINVASCGLTYAIGEISLIVLHETHQDGVYYAMGDTVETLNPIWIWRHFNVPEDLNVPAIRQFDWMLYQADVTCDDKETNKQPFCQLEKGFHSGVNDWELERKAISRLYFANPTKK